MAPSARLPWIDHLRTCAIFLVVCMHACVTYSHVGDWYFMAERDPAMPVKLVFILWQGHLQAFFMGLLFFLAGYFAHGSLQRRGPGAFLRERLVRLGLPTLLYMLAIHPFMLLGLNPWHHDFGPKLAWYGRYLAEGRFVRSSGPLWFAFALLIFCAMLAAWEKFRGGTTASRDSEPRGEGAPAPVSAGRLWLFAAGLVVATFLIRTMQPIGTNVSNFQLCFFPQYVAVFIAGLAAARHGWLLALARSPLAARAGWLGLVGGPLLLALVAGLGGPPGPSPNAYDGGWHLQALGVASWEQFSGVALGLGMLAWFSRRFDRDTPRLRWLADRSFGVYVLHAPVLVALTMLFRPIENAAGPFVMAALVTLAGLVISYALADLARRLPGLRAIL